MIHVSAAGLVPAVVMWYGSAMTDQNPILFLDVDGVINVFAFEDFNTVEPLYHGGDSMAAVVSKTIRETVKPLIPEFDIVWATAWGGSARPTFDAFLGFESQGHISYFPSKIIECIRWAGERPWAFVDDEVDFDLRMSGLTREQVPGFLLETNDRVGLTSRDVDELLTWKADLRA